MYPLLMVGAWAGAIIALTGVSRLAWKAFVAAVESVIRDSMSRMWHDMDDIEKRLSALEVALDFVRQQLADLREMMQAHITED